MEYKKGKEKYSYIHYYNLHKVALYPTKYREM